jgi:hypothetical protein
MIRFASLFAALLVASPVAAQDRLALVVGIDKYEKLPPLSKAGNDAVAVGAALGKLGFSVDVVRDSDRRSFNRRLSDFLNKIKPGAIVYFHFSGHGVSIDGDSFLIPADMDLPRAGDREFVKREAIRLSELIDSFKNAQAQARIMVIDACRENPFAQKGVRNLGTRGGLALVPAPKGTLIMYSAADGQLALDQLGPDDKEPTSVYTRTLLKHLAQADTDLVAAARAIRAEVERMAASIGHEQRPAYYDELSDELILAVAAAVNAKRAVVQQGAKAGTVPPQQSAKLSAPADPDGKMLKDVDLPGLDFLTFPLSKEDPALCQAACRADGRCVAWTYVSASANQFLQEGTTGRGAAGSSRCWLKTGVSFRNPQDCCTSGIERGQPTVSWPRAGGAVLAEISIHGGDYFNFAPARIEPKFCQNACREDKRCLAWTYQNPIAGWPKGMCWLKNRITFESASSCCTSGIERLQ